LDSGLQVFARLQVFFTSDRKSNGGSFGHFFISSICFGLALNFMKPSLNDDSVSIVIVFVSEVRGELQYS